MNTTGARAGLTPQIWDDKFFAEYVRQNRFARYMGEDEAAMIQVKEDLTRKQGDSITFAFQNALVGAGVTGNQLLEGNEEVLDLRSMKLTVAPVRHGVAVTNWDEQKSAIDLRNAARSALLTWEKNKMKADLITAFLSINGVAYAAATTTQRNTWLVANSDRILYGSQRSNLTGASGVHATALATIDNTADKMSGAVLSLAKRIAKMADPAIRPLTVKDDEEWFVAWLHSYAFRDFRNDPAVLAVQKDANERGKDNPLFTGGDLLWDGIIVKEIPEFPTLTGVGTAGIDVAPSVLVGAQALGVGWAQRLKTTTNVRDYGYVNGVGLQEMRGLGKLQFGKNGSTDTADLVDHGVVTIFTAGVADA